MTLAELKAWLEGYMHGKDAPSPDDWKLISEKLDTVRGEAPSWVPFPNAGRTIPRGNPPMWKPDYGPVCKTVAR